MGFLTPEEIESLQPRLMVLRIIMGALAAAILVFCAVAFLAKPRPLHWDVGFFEIFGIGFAAACVVGWFVAPWVMRPTRGVIGETRCEGAQTALQTQSIMRGALVEGAAFFNLVFVLQEASGVNLVVALACLPFLISLVPFGSSYVRTIERILDE